MVDFGDASGGGRAPFTSSPGSFSTMVDFGRRFRALHTGALVISDFSRKSPRRPAPAVYSRFLRRNIITTYNTKLKAFVILTRVSRAVVRGSRHPQIWPAGRPARFSQAMTWNLGVARPTRGASPRWPVFQVRPAKDRPAHLGGWSKN